MDASFTLDNIERSNIEMAAGRDDISMCTCSAFCLRETGRNACPCRSAEQFCTVFCHSGARRSTCMNTRRVLQDDSLENDDVSVLKVYFYLFRTRSSVSP